MKQFICLFVFISLVIYIPAFSQVESVHLSWNSEKEQATEETMAITWFSKGLTRGMVKYGTDRKLLQSHPAVGTHSAFMNTYIYKADLTKLKTSTLYYYQCGSEKSGWSEIYTFQTAPRLGSKTGFMVGVWGDTQDNEFNTSFQKSAAIVQQIRKHPVNFTIHMGDIVNNGSQVSSWDLLFRTTEPINAFAPFMPVTGNHDVNNEPSDPGFQMPFPVFHELFNLPEDDINYSFNYGNAHFVAINSGFAKEAEKSGDVLFERDSREYQWLDDDLSNARRNKDITWIILYTHYPIYSYGWSHVPAWQRRITPLLDQYNVDLCLAGHRHVYERHAAIRNNQILSLEDNRVYQRPAGTVYITNGTAGGSPQGIGGKDLPSMVFTSPRKMYNYAIMTIEDNALTYVVYNEESEIIDRFQIIK